mgnify:CR=1 FL=1
MFTAWLCRRSHQLPSGAREERTREIGLVDHLHQSDVLFGLGLRLEIVIGPGQAEPFALPDNRPFGMCGLIMQRRCHALEMADRFLPVAAKLSTCGLGRTPPAGVWPLPFSIG